MNNHRNYIIDFLRGIAIFVVLILHFNISYSLDQSALNHVFSSGFIKAVASNGNYGVTIFFVISGFLITSTSLKRYGRLSDIDAVSFYILRFARIMPCLVLVLALIALFGFLQIPIFQNKANSTSFALAIISVLTFWHNILMDRIGYFNYCLNILWSLSVEEIFYFAFPLLCILLKKTRLILIFLLAVIVVSPIYRSHYIDNEIVALYGYLSCFDAIAIGCATAVIARKIQLNDRVSKWLLYAAGLFMVGVYFYGDIMENVVLGVTLMSISTAIYLIGASANNAINNNSLGLITKIICWFGRNSYELYLFHIIVLALMKTMLTRDDLGDYTKIVWMMVFFVASVLAAGVISRFYSQPMNVILRNYLCAFRQKSIVPNSPIKKAVLSLTE